jgi:hypothetical protein
MAIQTAFGLLVREFDLLGDSDVSPPLTLAWTPLPFAEPPPLPFVGLPYLP